MTKSHDNPSVNYEWVSDEDLRNEGRAFHNGVTGTPGRNAPNCKILLVQEDTFLLVNAFVFFYLVYNWPSPSSAILQD